MANPLEELPGGDVKIGGRSVYVYGIAVGAVVLIYLWWSGRNSSGYAETAAEPQVAYADVSGDLGDLPRSTTGDNQDLDVPGPTNLEWETKVIAYMVTQGKSPLAVQRAIQLYQQGEQLTYEQTTILNMAVSRFGPPPEGIYSAPMTTDKPPTAAKPAEIRWTAKTETWLAVGTVNGYSKPDRASKVRYRKKANSRFTTRQTATVGGVRWVRSSGGVCFNTNDLRPYVKPKAKPKAKKK